MQSSQEEGLFQSSSADNGHGTDVWLLLMLLKYSWMAPKIEYNFIVIDCTNGTTVQKGSVSDY